MSEPDFKHIVKIYRHHQKNLQRFGAAGTLGAELLRKHEYQEYTTARALLVEYLSDVDKQATLLTSGDDIVRVAALELIKEFDL